MNLTFKFIFFITFANVGCSSVFYYPVREDLFPMEKLQNPPESIRIPVEKNESVEAWYFHAKRVAPKGILVQFHGNGANQSSHFAHFYAAIKDGYDLLTFDYRGYGRSDGKRATPAGTVLDGIAVLKWVKENRPHLPLVVIGQSLGGAVLMRTLEELGPNFKVDLLVLDSTFASYRSAARRVMQKNWITWLLQPLAWLIVDNSMEAKSKINQLGSYPKLVVHGTADRVVDYRLGEEVFSLLPEPKEFWSIEGADHTQYFPGGWPRLLQSFLKNSTK